MSFLRRVSYIGAFAGFVWAASACSTELDRRNPFDEKSDPANQATGEINGRITLEGEFDHAGIEVRFDGPSKGDVSTQANGDFALNGLLPGAYKVIISTRGFNEITVATEVNIAGQTTMDPQLLGLRRATVAGIVTTSDAAEVSPSGAIVNIVREKGPRDQAAAAPGWWFSSADTATVDAMPQQVLVGMTGTYTFNAVPAGTYAMTVVQDGAAPVTTRFTVTGDSTVVTPEALELRPLTGAFEILGTLADGTTQSSSYTAQRRVALNLLGFNAAHMQIGELVEGQCVDVVTSTFAAQASFDIASTGDGVKTLCVRFVDALGNVSQQQVSQIILDTTAPVINRLELNGGAAFTTAGNVALDLVATDASSGLAAVEYTVNAGSTLVIEPYAPFVGHPQLTAGGLYTFAVRVRDRAGHMSDAVDATIDYDTTPPVPGSVPLLLAGGDSVVSETLLSATLDASGADEMQLSTDSGFSAAPWVAYATSALIAVSASDGLKTVYVRFRDRAGHVTVANSATVTVDRSAPEGLSLSGPAATQSTTVTLGLTASDAHPPIQVRLSQSPDLAGSVWVDLTPTVAFGPLGSDGIHTIYAQFRDAVGNTSAALPYSVSLDSQAPTNPSLSIQQAPYTTVQAITLVLGADGASEVQVSQSPVFSGAIWEPLSLTKTFTLGAGEGGKTVYARYRDAAGNSSGSVSATTILDTQDPAAPTVSVNGGAALTNSNLVVLNLGYGLDAVQMQLSNQSSFSGAAWIAVTSTANFDLGGASTVYVRVRDAAGRISASGFDSITVDNVAPSFATLAIVQSPSTNNQSVNLTLVASGADQMRIGNDSGFAGASWQTYFAATTYTLPAGDGLKTVYVQLRDTAGNTSVILAALTTLDTGAPTAPQIVLDSGAIWSTDLLVNVALGSEGATHYCKGENSNLSGCVWTPITSTTTHSFTAGEGLRSLYVKYRDAGMNETAIVADTIYVDTVDPAGVTISLAEGATVRSRSVNLILTATEGNALDMQVSNDSGFVGAGWESFSTSKIWTLAAGADGPRYVYFRVRDAAGRTVTASNATTALDTQAPNSPAVSVVQGSATNLAKVTLALSAVGASSVLLSEDASFAATSPSAYATSKPFTLSAGDGVKTIYARFDDTAGNSSTVVQATLLKDTVAPGSVTGVIQQGDYTTAAAISLSLYAVGAEYMAVNETGNFAAPVWIAYSPVLPYSLSATGFRYVYLKFKDAAGNQSGVIKDSITYDNAAPTGGTLTLTGSHVALQKTNTRNITATISGLSGATQQQVSLSSLFIGADWQAAGSTHNVYLSGNDGVTVVYARARDAAGNVGGVFSRQITLDTQAPNLTSLQLNAGAVFTKAQAVTATTVQVGDAVTLKLFDGATSVFSGAYSASRSLTLNNNDGYHTVTGYVLDAVDNRSATLFASIGLDRVAPVAAININSGAVYTTSQSVTLDLTAFDTGSGIATNGIKLANLLAQVAATAPVAYVSPKAHMLASGQGLRTVYYQVLDAAGNKSLVVSDSITRDSVAPLGGAINILATRTNQSVTDATLTVPAEATQMKISHGNNACSGGTWSSTDTAASIILDASNTTQYASVQFKDAAGNTSLCASDSVIVDTAGPVPSAFTATGSGGAPSGYSKSNTIALNWSTAAGDCNLVQISEDIGFLTIDASDTVCTAGTLASFTFNPTFDGVHTVYLRMRDSTGNYGPSAAVSVIVDTAGPSVPTGGFTIQQGAYAKSTSLGLNLLATGALEYQVAEGASCSGIWTAMASTANFVLNANAMAAPITDTFSTTVVNPAYWSASSGAINTLGVAEPSATNSYELNQTDALQSIALNAYANRRYIYHWQRNAGVTAADFLYFEYFDGSSWITLNSHSSSTGSTAVYTKVSGTLPVVAERIRFRAFTASTARNFYVDDIRVQGDPVSGQVHQVSVRYRDAADNQSGCYTQSIILDTVLPTLTLGAPTQSNVNVVPLTLTFSADASDLMLSNIAGFPGTAWQSLVSSTSWQLLAGDGSKQVYAKVRDLASNESTVAVSTILLDATPPETPSLRIEDTSGDGYSVSLSTIELALSIPNDSAQYVVERMIVDYSNTWTEVSTGSAVGDVSYMASVTQPGYEYQFRVRARDATSNWSAWSVPEGTVPYEPIYRIAYSYGSDQRYRYSFPPSRGTFGISAIYSYENATGSVFNENVANNIPYWEQNWPTTTVWNEKLKIRTNNQDNTLVYDSEFDLGRNVREIAAQGGDNGLYPVGTVDRFGRTHILYIEGWYNTLYYAVRINGRWVTEVLEADDNTTKSPGYEYAIDVDMDGNPHVVYMNYNGSTGQSEFWYGKKTAGVWTKTMVESGLNSNSLAIAVGPTYIYTGRYANGALRYARRNTSGGAWSSGNIGTNSAGYRGVDIALDASNYPYYTYVHTKTGAYEVKMATPTGYASWTTAMVDRQSLLVWPDIELDSAKKAYISYTHAAFPNKIKYATNASGAWVLTQIATPQYDYSTKTVLKIDHLNKPHIAYSDAAGGTRLYYATCASGGCDVAGNWTIVNVYDDANEDLSANSGAFDDSGRLHYIYWDWNGKMARYIRYATKPIVEWTTPYTTCGSGPNSAEAGAIRSTGYYNVLNACGEVLSGTDFAWSDLAAPTFAGTTKNGITNSAILGTNWYLFQDNGATNNIYYHRSSQVNPFTDSSWVGPRATRNTSAPHVVYSTNASPSVLKYASVIGSTQTFATEDITAAVVGASSLDYYAIAGKEGTGGFNPGLSVGPYVAYVTSWLGSRLYLAVKTASGWTHQLLYDTYNPGIPASADFYIYDVSMVLDSDNALHILFAVDNNSLSLHYLTNESGSWVEKELDSGIGSWSYNSERTSLQIDPYDNLYFMYTAGGNIDTYLFVRHGQEWHKNLISTSSNAPALIVDPLTGDVAAVSSNFTNATMYQNIAGVIPNTDISMVSPY